MKIKCRIYIKKYWYELAFVFFFMIASFLHLYQLDAIPYGIHVDEAGAGYDAWCLANFGVDRYSNHLPVYFINFGGGQSVMYGYLCSLLIKITGGDVSVLLIRLPAAIFGVTTVIFGTLIFKKCIGKKGALIGMALLTICPFFIMNYRFGLDCNLMLPMCTITIYLFMCAVEKQRLLLWVITGVSTGLILYTYALSYIVVPLFLIFTIAYLIYTKKINIKNLFVFFFVVLIMVLPLLLFVYINNFDKDSIILPFMTIPRVTKYRNGELAFSISGMMENTDRLFECLFFRDGLVYTAFSKYFTLYIVSIPFVMLGITLAIYKLILSLQKKQYEADSLLSFLFFSILILGCLLRTNGPNTYRLNAIFVSLIYMATLGIIYGYKHMNNWKKGYAVIIAILYIGNFLLFCRCYFVNYVPSTYPQQHFETSFQEAVDYLNNQGLDGDIYISLEQQPYIYYYLDNLPTPQENNMKKSLSELRKSYPVVDRYDNVVFCIPDKITAHSSYIVKQTDELNLKKIQDSQIDFNEEKVGDYFVYYCFNN